MGRIFFIAKTYSPNAASDIRYRSFLSGLKGEKEISFVFFLPDEKRSKFVSTEANIKVVHKWKTACPSNKILKQVFYFYHLIKFVFLLKSGDVVIDLACCEMLPFLLLRKDIKVYYEISEHPEVSLSSSRVFAPSLKIFISQCKRLNGLFVISNALKEFFVAEGVSEERIHIINMTVDESRFSFLKKTIKERYIAYCGTASNNKDGVNQLILSFANVVRKHPNIKLYIIGKNPDKNQEFSNGALVKVLQLEDNIIFTGALPYTQIPQLLKDAEILALARPDNKQAKYGFPTKLGEYLMTGNPVVITNVGDVSLFLTDKKNALIAEPDNVESFSEKLIWAIENPEEAQLIGIQGKMIAQKCFNGTIEGRKILQIVNS